MTPLTPLSPFRQSLYGVLFACMATSLGGMTVALTRLIIHQSDPLSLTFVRYGLGTMVLLLFLLPSLRFRMFLLRDLLWMTLLGAVMFAAFPYFMARALEDTTAARGALLFSTMPLITMALAATFKIERMTAQKGFSVALAIAGAALALSESTERIAPNALRGDFYMFLATLCACSFNIFSQRFMTRYGNMRVLVYTMFAGIMLLFVLALAFGQPFSGSLDFDASGWFIVFMLAIPGCALMMYTWSRALQLISPTQVAITVGLNPLTAIALGAWLMAEPVSWQVMAGFLLIAAAIVLANLRRRAKP
jgi:drug/metabolite transporter (DMT)-like permease